MTTKTNNVVDLFARAGIAEPVRRFDPERLRDARKAKGYNQREFADLIDVTRQSVSQWELGSKRPDGATLTRIVAALEQPLSYFSGVRPQLFGESSAAFYRAFGTKTQKKNDQCDVWKEWLVQTASFFATAVKLPEPQIADWESKSSDGSYTAEELEQAARAVRRYWGLGDGPIANVVSLLESRGIIMTRVPFGAKDVNAFSYWNGDRPFIFLSSDTKSCARLRYDASHELAHLTLHRGIASDELEDPQVLRRIEREADRFAAAFLLPEATYPNEVLTSRLEGFKELKRRWKVSIQAQVFRCEDLSIFSETQILNMRKSISKNRWKTNEPLDDEILLERPSLLNKCLTTAVEAGGADPDDIVAGINLNPNYIAAFCGVKPEIFKRNEDVVSVTLK